jgi:hypothetical protein
MKRALLLLTSLFLSLCFLELALTAAYGELGQAGPLEVVSEFGSPFVFRAKPENVGNPYSLRRKRPVDERAAAGTTRVLSYGDSIAAGYELEERETYAYLLEEQLRATRGSPVEVLNMVRGHSPSVYAFHLRADVPRYAPDGVVLEIELLNDVSDEAHVRTSGLDEDGLAREIHSHRYILGWDGHLLAPLSFSGSFIERTKLYAKLTRWYGRLRNRLSPNPLFDDDSTVMFYSSSADRYLLTRDRLDAGFERLFETIAGMRRYLERRDIRFLLVILPSRYAFTEEPFSAAARELLARAETRARELEIPYVAPARGLARRGGAELYMDFCHPTAEGNRAIAAELEPILAKW